MATKKATKKTDEFTALCESIRSKIKALDSDITTLDSQYKGRVSYGTTAAMSQLVDRLGFLAQEVK